MHEIIKLLPEAVANQIAAGEVIQRPASVVKELMENAIDSGATEIKLQIKQAGKASIQVIDNGLGMSDIDARMCWERHATSKLTIADDLFAIQTKGFRGEALASIAAISQVELWTRNNESEVGTHVVIAGSVVKKQEPIATPIGSRFWVKNLFFNVPARRNFLKSDPVETRHIIEEFHRVSIAHPELNFTFYNDDKEVYVLPKSNLKQRITRILGKRYEERLLKIEADTDIVSISGFVGKPEFARKSRGEQYFFVNKRYIKNPYLGHAISTGYSDLIPKDVYPSFFIFLEVDPASIDVNIHPTKTEIKFEEERNIYSILLAAVKQALGRFNAAPSIDFNQPEGFDIDVVTSQTSFKSPEIKVDKTYNPFDLQKSDAENQRPADQKWESLYDLDEVIKEIKTDETSVEHDSSPMDEVSLVPHAYQFEDAYIVTALKQNLVVIDQYRAHFRTGYENLKKNLKDHPAGIQRLLFPQSFSPEPNVYKALLEIKALLQKVGFELDWMKQNEILIKGVPGDLKIKNPEETLQYLADEWILDTMEEVPDSGERLAIMLAAKVAIRKGQRLKQEEINRLVEDLFSCENPYFSPQGKPIMFTLSLQELQNKFE